MLPLRMRVMRSAVGLVEATDEMGHRRLDLEGLLTSLPFHAWKTTLRSCLNMILEILDLRYTPFERPVMMQRLETRDAELFRGRAFNACWAVKRS